MVRESNTLLQPVCDRPTFRKLYSPSWRVPYLGYGNYYLPYVPHEYITQHVGGSSDLSLYGIIEGQSIEPSNMGSYQSTEYNECSLTMVWGPWDRVTWAKTGAGFDDRSCCILLELSRYQVRATQYTTFH